MEINLGPNGAQYAGLGPIIRERGVNNVDSTMSTRPNDHTIQGLYWAVTWWGVWTFTQGLRQ